MALGPLPDVRNVARIKALGAYQGQPWVAQFYWHYNASVLDDTGMTNLLNGFQSATNTNLAPAANNSVTITSWSGWDLSTRLGVVGTIAGTFVGSRAGTAMTVQDAVVSSWTVSYRWRGGHFRTYWPFGVQPDFPDGRLMTTAAQLAIRNALTSWMTQVNGITVNGQGGHLTGVRYVHTPVKGQPPVYFDPPLDLPVVNVAVHRRLDTQRRRLGKETG